MQKSRALLLAASLVFGRQAGADSELTYTERTGPEVKLLRVQNEDISHGSVLHLTYSNGQNLRIESDLARATTLLEYSDPVAGTHYTARREGDMLLIEGTLGGKLVSRPAKIDAHPWCESLEFSLGPYALSRPRAPALCWVIVPDNAAVYLIIARIEKRERVSLDNRSVETTRVRVALRGIPAFLWSTLYWFRQSDGQFVRFEGPRGGFGSPPTILELVEGTPGAAAGLTAGGHSP